MGFVCTEDKPAITDAEISLPDTRSDCGSKVT